MAAYRGVIFDFDGVLGDTEPIAFQIYQEILADAGYQLDEHAYISNFVGRTELANAHTIVETYTLSCTPESLVARVHAREAQLLPEAPLKEGARELLDRLKELGVPMAIGSSSERARALSILDAKGMGDYFDALVFSCDVSHGKPAPDIFALAAKRLGLDPAQCLVVEDSQAGIEAACAAGIDVVCIPDLVEPDDAHRDMATVVLPSLDALGDWLAL